MAREYRKQDNKVLKEFKSFMAGLRVANLATTERGIYSSTLEDRANARAVLNNVASVLGMPRPNYDDEQEVGRLTELARSYYADKAVEYFDSNSEGILDEVGDKGLANLVLGVEPAELKNNSKGSNVAEKHKKVLRYKNLLDGLVAKDESKRIPYDEGVAKEILTEAQEMLDEFLSGKPYSDKTKELAKEAMKYVIEHREEAGVYVLNVLLSRTMKDFTENFRSNREIASYVRENIRRTDKEYEKKLPVMELIDRVAA